MVKRILYLAAVLVSAAAFPVAAQMPELDNHYLDSAEVFIAPQEANSGGYTYVAIARMLEQPSSRTRGEGQFLVVGAGAGYQAGQRVWTRYYWRTRIATAEDVRLGKQVFAMDMAENNVYRQPNDRQEALNNGWWTATITDLSDMYKQQVTVAGEWHVNVNAMRVTR